MPKSKRPPRDYDAGMRIEPYVTDVMTDEQVKERFSRAVRSFFRNDPPRREPTPK